MSLPASSSRRYSLDWLRVFAIATVFVFHCSRFFDTGPWHVKNPTTHFTATLWTDLLAMWMMPIIFVISGASTYLALRSRRWGRFVGDRAQRLLIPLVVGCFTHVAWQVYLQRLTQGQFRGSFWAFYPRYFHGFYGSGGNFAWMGLHLWYLEALFLYSLLLLPVFLWLSHGSGTRFRASLCAALSRPGAVYLPALLIAVATFLPNPHSLLGSHDFGAWPLPAYLVLFPLGFLLVADPQLDRSVQDQRRFSLAAGVICMAALPLTGLAARPPYGTLKYDATYALLALSSWSLILAAWGFARGHLERESRKLSYLNEAVLPFYVLHQTIILSVGYFVVRWSLPDPLKAVIIAALAFTAIALLYEGAIRRVRVLRFLFGMKVARRAALPRPDFTAGRAAGEPTEDALAASTDAAVSRQ